MRYPASKILIWPVRGSAASAGYSPAKPVLLRMLLIASPILIASQANMHGQGPVKAVGNWTRTAGASAANRPGVYGTPGIASPINILGGRWSSSSWTDGKGNFWLLGAQGLDGNGRLGSLNGLWIFTRTCDLLGRRGRFE